MIIIDFRLNIICCKFSKLCFEIRKTSIETNFTNVVIVIFHIFQAGMLTFPNGTQSLIIAGDIDGKQCEMFSFQTSSWMTIPNLPKVVWIGAGVSFDNAFAVMGGSGENSKDMDRIYVVHSESMTWSKIRQRLAVPRSDFMVLNVPCNDYHC